MRKADTDMELGSNFELDLTQSEYKKDNIFNYLNDYYTVYTDSGRSAIRLLNKVLKKGTILLPDYICESVLDIYKNDYKICFYKINRDMTIDIDDLQSKMDSQVTVVYLMHYFGSVQNHKVLKYLEATKKECGYTIIEDTTHSIFTKERTIGDYCVCSLRKWFPVADGGVLYTKKNVTDIWDMAEYRKNYFVDSLEAMILKKYYIQYGIDCNSIYREIFAKSEQQLDMQAEIYQISDISKSILECISIKQLQEKRKKNYCQLKGKLKNIPVKDVLSTDNFVPLVYPVYVENRNQFRQYLMENKIYCAVHWPLTGTELENDTDAVKIYENIISLPIDQRYEGMHMEYLAQVIKAYFKEEKQDGIN